MRIIISSSTSYSNPNKTTKKIAFTPISALLSSFTVSRKVETYKIFPLYCLRDGNGKVVCIRTFAISLARSGGLRIYQIGVWS